MNAIFSGVLYLCLCALFITQQCNAQVIQSGLLLHNATIHTINPLNLTNTGYSWSLYLYFKINDYGNGNYNLLSTSEMNLTITQNGILNVQTTVGSTSMYIDETNTYIGITNINGNFMSISDDTNVYNFAGNLQFHNPTNFVWGSVGNNASIVLQHFLYFNSYVNIQTSPSSKFFNSAEIHYDFTRESLPSNIDGINYLHYKNVIYLSSTPYTRSVYEIIYLTFNTTSSLPVYPFFQINNVAVQIYCNYVFSFISCDFTATTFNLNTVGEYAINYSFDNITFVTLNKNLIFANISTFLPNSTNTYTQPFGIVATTEDKNISDTFIYAGISICSFILIFGLLIVRLCNWNKFNEWCSKLDYLRLNIRETYPVDHDEYTVNPLSYDTTNIKNKNIVEQNKKFGIGLSYKIHKQTTIFGGILTIICTAVSVLLITIYLYYAINNNTIVFVNSSISNGNVVDSSKNTLNITVTSAYVPSVYPCTTNPVQGHVVGPCINFAQSGTLPANAVCEQIPSEIEYYNHCVIHFVHTGGFQQSSSIGVQYLSSPYTNVTVTTNSYIQKSTINNVISDKKTFSGVQHLQYTLTPVSYSYYNDPITTGYVLDYTSNNVVNSLPIEKYVQSMNMIYIDFTLNNNWLFSSVKSSTTNIVILAQCFAIVGGVFGIGRIIVQIFCNNLVRKTLFRLSCLRYTTNTDVDIKKINANPVNSTRTTMVSNADTIRESMSYVERMNNFSHMRTGSEVVANDAVIKTNFDNSNNV